MALKGLTEKVIFRQKFEGDEEDLRTWRRVLQAEEISTKGLAGVRNSQKANALGKSEERKAEEELRLEEE